MPGAQNETRLAIASADTAYAITDTGAPDTPLNVYVTHDRAAALDSRGDAAHPAARRLTWAPVADANDPNVVTARVFLMTGGQSDFVTYDGGVTWAAIKTYLTPSSFATAQGKIYGVVDFNYPHTGRPTGRARLAAPGDQRRSHALVAAALARQPAHCGLLVAAGRRNARRAGAGVSRSDGTTLPGEPAVAEDALPGGVG